MKQKILTILLLFIVKTSVFAQLTNYSFSTLNSTYTPIVGGVVLGNATTDDVRFVDPTVLMGGNTLTGVGFPIGFNFEFDNATFDRFGINANGWIVLGNSSNTPAVTVGANQGGNYSPISAGNAGFLQVISPFGVDIEAQAGAELRTEIVGTMPNRICIVQWKDYRKYNQTGDNFNFQIRLYESSNIIDFHYGAFINSGADAEIEVGLKGSTNTNYVNRQGNNWISSTNGNTNNAKMELTSSIFPATGTVYRWSPPVQTVLDPQALIFVTPINTGCLNSSEVVTVRVKNNGLSIIDFTVNNLLVTISVTGVNPLNFPPLLVNTGTLAVGATKDIIVSINYNMTAVGDYNFSGTIAMISDGNTANNTFQNMTRTVIATKSLPYSQEFNTTVNPTTIDWAGNMIITPNHGVNNSNGLNVNMWANNQNAVAIAPKVGPITSSTVLKFDYRILDYVNNGYPLNTDSTIITNLDSINIEVSNQCGIVYSSVFSITGTNHIPSKSFRTMSVSLAAFAGQNIFIRFRTKWDDGDYYVDIDNINIDTPQAVDIKSVSFINPVQVFCFGTNETVKVRVQNYGTSTIDFAANNLFVNSKVSGAVTQTFSPVTINSGTLSSGSFLDVSISNSFNMTIGGNYKFEATTSISGDVNLYNDTAKTQIIVPATSNLPYTQNFETGTMLNDLGWAGNNMTINANHGVGNSRGLNVNLWSNIQNAQARTLKLLNIQPNSTFNFDYRVLEYVGGNYPNGADSTILTNSDSINVEISTNCGVTYSNLHTITGSNHVASRSFLNKNLSIGSFVGQDIYVRFRLKWGAGDYYVDIDNINVQTPGATGVQNSFVAKTNQISVYPNPTSGIVTIDLPENEEVNLKINNSIGETIIQKTVASSTKVDLSNYPAGIYTVSGQNEKNISTKKINLVH